MSGNNLGGLSSGNRTINGFTDTGSSASLTVGDELKLKTTSKIYIGQNQGTEGQVITRAGDGIVWQAQADTKGVSITNRDTSHDISVLHPTFIEDYTGSSLSSHVDVFSAKNTLILDPSNAIFDISNVALRIPRGASAGRPKNLTAEDVGYIRYNTELNQFEGYGAGAAWGSLGGVKDIDGDTYITAESTTDSDKLQFYTADAERMVIDPLGKVGIGTTSPSTTLQITKAQADEKSSGTYAHLYLNNSSTTNITGRTSIFLHTSHTTNSKYGISLCGDRADTGGTPTFAIRTHDNSEAGSTAFTVKNSGNVGIGTTDPSGKLHVYNGNILLENSGSDALDNKIIFREAGYDDRFFIATDLAHAPSNQQSLRFGFTDAGDTDITNDNVLVNIRGDGNVGIGTTGPDHSLHITGGNARVGNGGGASTGVTGGDRYLKISAESEDNNAAVYLGCCHDENGAHKTAIIAENVSSWSKSNLHFCLNDSTGTGANSIEHDATLAHSRMTILNDGNVGIGTTDPGDYKLKVDGSANITGNLTAGRAAIGNSGHGSYASFSHKDKVSSTTDYGLIHKSDGTTILNSKSNKILYLRQGNVDAATFAANGGAFTISRATTINGALTVSGTITGSLSGNADTATTAEKLSAGNKTINGDLTVSSALGIGTAAPNSKFLIDLQRSGQNNYIRIQGADTSSNNKYSGILFSEHNNEYGWYIRNSGNDYLYFSKSSGDGTEINNKITINTHGNVTIAEDLTVSGTITGNGSGLTNITKAMVGLGNVANVNLGNVINESKATMFASPTFTGRPIIKTTNDTTAGLWILEKNASNNNEGFFIGRTGVETEDDFGIWGAGADADTAGAWRLRLDKNGRMLLGDNLTDTSIDTNYQLQVKGTANITENLTVDGELDALGGTLRVKDNRIGISTDPDSSAKVLIGGSLSTNGDCKLGGNGNDRNNPNKPEDLPTSSI